ncbi:Hypothetical predicted protein [Cloeon dipterum]|uniref:Uncharacterized protein n=1 Tax=Cloeon dipterum TaxID=197152 RepID=A0A8S1D9U7_9INSE|nr:Hypothetical predicted protein [Cloeon dipterum]
MNRVETCCYCDHGLDSEDKCPNLNCQSMRDYFAQNAHRSNSGTEVNTDDSSALLSKGFCLMCEKEVDNIEEHWKEWHQLIGGGPNPCYLVKQFESKRLLFYKGTKLKGELQKCPVCAKVLYNHRFLNHQCFVIPTNRPALIPNRNWGYCLMCKFNFEDLIDHVIDLHGKNFMIFDIRKIFGQWTLLPGNTCDKKELTQCRSCFMPIYNGQVGSHQC